MNCFKNTNRKSIDRIAAGVEHLLRDVKDLNITSLSQQVTEKILSLRALQLRLVEAHECVPVHAMPSHVLHLKPFYVMVSHFQACRYLKDVIALKLPINHEITQLLQVPKPPKNKTPENCVTSPALAQCAPLPRRTSHALLLLQDVFNLLPNLDVDAIIRAFTLQVPPLPFIGSVCECVFDCSCVVSWAAVSSWFRIGLCARCVRTLTLGPADQRHDARHLRFERGKAPGAAALFCKRL